MARKKTCKTCVYWEYFFTDKHRGKLGHCHHHWDSISQGTHETNDSCKSHKLRIKIPEAFKVGFEAGLWCFQKSDEYYEHDIQMQYEHWKSKNNKRAAKNSKGDASDAKRD